MKGQLSSSSFRAGLSLVEMLTVIAVIGILVAVAIPALGRVNRSAAESKDLQNARILASVCQSAQAAGVDFVDPNGDLQVTIRNIQAGAVATRLDFAGQAFCVSIADRDIPGASRHLYLRAGLLIFDPQ
jgi:prepilin-type N-terminal cleavage/methylation domain-containing protein